MEEPKGLINSLFSMSHRDKICPAKHKPSKIFAEWKGEQAVGIGSSD